MTRILFVCTGNTCRSPMAESLLRHMNLPGIEVKSAGVFAVDGSTASNYAQKVLNEQAIQHDHRASLLQGSLVNWSDYILTMTRGHKESILTMYPESHKKVFTIKEFAGVEGALDVADPFGGSLEIYRETFQELKETMAEVAKRLEKETL